MNDEELRAIVREAVARHLGPAETGEPRRAITTPARGASTISVHTPPAHASHFVYVSLVNTGDACLIEPSVECTHCNYCKSHGH